jgi:dTDP-4-dehydrorhamnose reductase
MKGVTSWYDFAKAILLSATSVRVKPLMTNIRLKAIRPVYSVMDKSKIKNTFDIQIPYWRDSLAELFDRFKW